MKAIIHLYSWLGMRCSSVAVCAIFVIGCHAGRGEGTEKHSQATLIQSRESQDFLFSGKGQLVSYLEIKEVASGKHFFILVPNQNLALPVDSLVAESPHFLSLSELTNYVWSLDCNFKIEECHEQPFGSGKYEQVLRYLKQAETLCREQVDPPIQNFFEELIKSSNPSIRNDSTIRKNQRKSPIHHDNTVAFYPCALAAIFTHRFSTKPWCPVTGLCEYQTRKHRPEIGRWLNRDPIGEGEP